MNEHDRATIQEFYALVEAEWERGLREHPERATYLGDPRYNDRFTDHSPEAIEARMRREKEVLTRLEAIDATRWPEEDRLNYDLFRKEYEVAVAGHPFPAHLLAVSPLYGPQVALPQLMAVTPFQTRKDYEDALARMAAFPRLVDQTIDLLTLGIERGWTLPAVTLRGVPDQIEAHLRSAPEDTPFFKPFASFPPTIEPSHGTRLQEAALERIREALQPAYRKLADFLVKVYLPATIETVGMHALPDGREYYDYCCRLYTTTPLTPQEIHEIGKEEVKRILGEKKALIEEIGFAGDHAAFLEFLRTDPRFYYEDAQTYLRDYRDICKRIDPMLPKLFKTLPRIPYGVIPVPDYAAPSSPGAYYQPPAPDGSRPGYFFANTYDLPSRPKYEMEVLALHETVPGHHLQMALALERTDLPPFRKHGFHTAFIEGWGLYAEGLGETLGLYTDPYSKFGRLSNEIWRACRLVVDTGLHAFQWRREDAIAYMKAHTANTDHDIEVEVDRYLVMPGQALAYKIGEIRIRRLVEKARESLGTHFDIRDFHDLLLRNGPLPLDLLEAQVDGYLEAHPTTRG